MNNKNWGGKREGAGRKKSNKVKKMFFVTEEEIEKIKEYIKSLRSDKSNVKACKISKGD